MSKGDSYTPGPWEWYTSCSYSRLGTKGRHHELMYPVVLRDGQPHIEIPNRADRRLIAAAPDLLEALEQGVRRVEAIRDGRGSAEALLPILQAHLSAAIAKARGES